MAPRSHPVREGAVPASGRAPLRRTRPDDSPVVNPARSRASWATGVARKGGALEGRPESGRWSAAGDSGRWKAAGDSGGGQRLTGRGVDGARRSGTRCARSPARSGREALLSSHDHCDQPPRPAHQPDLPRDRRRHGRRRRGRVDGVRRADRVRGLPVRHGWLDRVALPPRVRARPYGAAQRGHLDRGEGLSDAQPAEVHARAAQHRAAGALRDHGWHRAARRCRLHRAGPYPGEVEAQPDLCCGAADERPVRRRLHGAVLAGRPRRGADGVPVRAGVPGAAPGHGGDPQLRTGAGAGRVRGDRALVVVQGPAPGGAVRAVRADRGVRAAVGAGGERRVLRRRGRAAAGLGVSDFETYCGLDTYRFWQAFSDQQDLRCEALSAALSG